MFLDSRCIDWAGHTVVWPRGSKTGKEEEAGDDESPTGKDKLLTPCERLLGLSMT